MAQYTHDKQRLDISKRLVELEPSLSRLPEARAALLQNADLWWAASGALEGSLSAR